MGVEKQEGLCSNIIAYRKNKGVDVLVAVVLQERNVICRRCQSKGIWKG